MDVILQRPKTCSTLLILTSYLDVMFTGSGQLQFLCLRARALPRTECAARATICADALAMRRPILTERLVLPAVVPSASRALPSLSARRSDLPPCLLRAVRD
eukprot:3688657-Rhodomonas_salina.2